MDNALQFVEVPAELFGEYLRGFFGIFVRAVAGLGNDVVDAAQLLDVGGGGLEGNGGLGALRCVAPHDGRAGLRRNYGVDGLLKDEDAVGDGEGECASGASFAGDGGDGGDAETGHFAEIAGDGLGLAALLGTDAGVGSHEVDEGEDRTAEFFGELHGAQSFAVALGVGHTKFAEDLFLRGAALEVADDHDFFGGCSLFAGETGEAAEHGRVVAKGAVAVNLAEVGEDAFNKTHRIGPLRVTGQLCLDPCGRLWFCCVVLVWSAWSLIGHN